MARFKKIVKFLIAVFLYYSGLLSLLARTKYGSSGKSDFKILMYHRVIAQNDPAMKYIQPGMYVTDRTFEKQIAFLSKKYNLISLKKLAEHLINEQTLPSRSVAVTFDDGWLDNYKYAFPILRKRNAPATIFLTTDYIDSDNAFWFADIFKILTGANIESDKLNYIFINVLGDEKYRSIFSNADTGEQKKELGDAGEVIEVMKQLDHETILKINAEIRKEVGSDSGNIAAGWETLSWKEILEMKNGGIDFGSHGCSHRIMSGLSESENERELTESKRIIEKKLGSGIDLFSYPNGDYDDRVLNLVKNCGFCCAVSTGSGKGRKSDIFALKRVNVHEGALTGPLGGFSRAMFSLHLYRNI